MTQARLHKALTLLWVVLVVPTLLFWRESIPWLSFMSIYAIIASHWACWEASTAKEAVDAEVTADDRPPRLEWETDE